MNSREKFYFDVEAIKSGRYKRDISIEPNVLLWANNTIECLEGEVEYFKEKFLKQINEIEECKLILRNGIDRDKNPEDTLRDLCVLATNGIYWRNRTIEGLHEENDDFWELLNAAADKAMEANNNWIALREQIKISKEAKG